MENVHYRLKKVFMCASISAVYCQSTCLVICSTVSVKC
ncbi:hypothetical protein APHNYW_0345 [Anaplasma phagocytophilum str. ApNYW]|nr:hypothetical protein APHHGE2_0614 [Anaplasma phagocytophilum str. HGE2]KJV87906.1 hypothetical protein APHNYW_0345 [Anaplasma phagocytophilum str. ApNYW]